MDYLLSFIGYSSQTPAENKKVKDTYPEQYNTIKTFLETRNVKSKHTHTPGCGGEHNPHDLRVKKGYNVAMSARVYKDFIDDININLPIILKNEMKNHQILTQRNARKLLTNYLYNK